MIRTASGRRHSRRLSLGCLGILFLGSLAGAQAKTRHTGPSRTAPPVVLTPTLFVPTPASIDFGAVGEGALVEQTITIRNDGYMPLSISSASFLLGVSGNSEAFTLTLAGQEYEGDDSNRTHSIVPPVTIGPSGSIEAALRFQPEAEQYDSFTLRLGGNFSHAGLPITGLGGHSGDPYLHVVIGGPSWAVDYDASGTESIVLDGSGSHTHEPGRSIVGYSWEVDGDVVSTSSTLTTALPLGESEVSLTITDDGAPPRTLEDHVEFEVVATDDVPGVLVTYYDASAAGASSLLDAVPDVPDFAEQRASCTITGIGQIGGSPFDRDTLVRIVGRVQLTQGGLYSFTGTGGVGRRIFVDEEPVTLPIFLGAGQHALEARFAVDTLSDMPLDVKVALNGGGATSIDEDQLSHDESTMAPVINSMNESGLAAGGTAIVIEGLGFHPGAEVQVHWGQTVFDAGDFTSLSPTEIRLTSPPGGGAIVVKVETSKGQSNAKNFVYLVEGPVPIEFQRELTLIISQATCGVFGPDGRLYVGALDGRIHAITFDENYEVVAQNSYAGVNPLSNREILGIAVNPFDPPSPVKLYIAHSDIYVANGVPPTGFVPYTGQISVLQGPNFNSASPLITGLPASNHDHGPNGIAFDNNGDLFISIGGCTNAGVSHEDFGGLNEAPFSGAILKARLSKPGFNGAVHHVETVGGVPNDDMRSAAIVDVASGIDVEVHAPGLRNAYGLVYTTDRRLYATDNGPNIGFGASSTGPDTQGPDPYDNDELNLVEWGNYYGHPNRNRGRTDLRQNVFYFGITGPASIPDVFAQLIAWQPPSSDGIDEYRAATFQGQMRGNLISQKYLGKLRRMKLRADGRAVLSQFQIDPSTGGLGLVCGPGGALVSLDYGSNQVEVLEPLDATPQELVVHDIFPWRAPATGGQPFVIGGRGFGTLANTTVTIGGHPAALASVGWGRIHGTIPAEIAPTTNLVDVVVTVGSDTNTLSAAFRYLYPPGNEPGRWETLASTPAALGEVAAGVIAGQLFLVGEGNGATFAYDLLNRQWLANKAARPFGGHHHAAEVVAGKLYLIGGLSGGSEGKVQIYDPVSNSWSLGTDMPWAAGSVSTAAIAGKIYVAGGIVGSTTVVNCAMYDPLADTWTSKAAMPDGGRNHTAAGTDGVKFWVFGGRQGGNTVGNGLDTTMVYDPVANTWETSLTSSLAALPERRGGMGKAIWYRGEFYVFGGETLNDPDANPNNVYDRVDVYRPATNAWRLEAPMPNPRHGIFPVLFQGHMFIAAGGTQAGFAQSTKFDAFTRQ